MKYNELLSQLKSDKLDAYSKIEFNYYLPFNEKYLIANALAINILEQNENGVYYINPIKQTMINDILLFRYTNIEKDDNKYDLEDYDFLKSIRFFDGLYNNMIYPQDYILLIETLEANAKALIEESKLAQSGAVGIIRKATQNAIDQLVEVYSIPESRKQIKAFLKDLNSNPELLDTVNALIGRMGLEEAKELIEKKFKEVLKEKATEKVKATEKTVKKSGKIEKEIE